ncbi:hypothetical protein JCM8547_007903 [Rhodosporidiobolus lusitaniae]
MPPASSASPDQTQQPRGRYGSGHRRASWTTQDVDQLVELRARQRTFDGAYQRTALANLAAALVVLKIFTPEFAKIGLIYVVLAILLLIIAQLRRKRSDHDFEDSYLPDETTTEGKKAADRLWGREFRTSGDGVVLISVVCAALILAIFVLVMRLED